MTNSVSLTSLFESQKDTLENRLKGLVFPNDAKEAQEIVSNYLNALFDTEGEFRLNLNKSEDYIFQAALSLLKAQQKIGAVFAEKVSSKGKNRDCISPIHSDSIENEETMLKDSQSTVDSSKALIGAGGGAIVGNVAFGGWGAIFGAIAGTAVAIYLCQTKKVDHHKLTKPKPILNEPKEVSTPIDVDSFVKIVAEICASLDTLISTYRAQINKVVSKFETVERPTLESEFSELLACIQSLLGAYAMNPSNELRSKRIDQRIQLLGEALENYDLSVVNYDGTNKQLFNTQPSENVTEDTMATPAILKSGKVIIKGKLFVKA